MNIGYSAWGVGVWDGGGGEGCGIRENNVLMVGRYCLLFLIIVNMNMVRVLKIF